MCVRFQQATKNTFDLRTRCSPAPEQNVRIYLIEGADCCADAIYRPREVELFEMRIEGPNSLLHRCGIAPESIAYGTIVRLLRRYGKGFAEFVKQVDKA